MLHSTLGICLRHGHARARRSTRARGDRALQRAGRRRRHGPAARPAGPAHRRLLLLRRHRHQCDAHPAPARCPGARGDVGRRRGRHRARRPLRPHDRRPARRAAGAAGQRAGAGPARRGGPGRHRPHRRVRIWWSGPRPARLATDDLIGGRPVCRTMSWDLPSGQAPSAGTRRGTDDSREAGMAQPRQGPEVKRRRPSRPPPSRLVGGVGLVLVTSLLAACGGEAAARRRSTGTSTPTARTR